MEESEEITLVLLLLVVIGSVALTLVLSFLHPRYRQLRPRLLLASDPTAAAREIFSRLGTASPFKESLRP